MWRSVLLVEETGGLGENHEPVASHCGQILSHNVVHLALVAYVVVNPTTIRSWPLRALCSDGGDVLVASLGMFESFIYEQTNKQTS